MRPTVRAALNQSKTCAWRNEPVQAYPSPEAYYREYPQWFNEYAHLCAQLYRENVGRRPGQDQLRRLIKNYPRKGTGWLDFLAAKQEIAPGVRLSQGAMERYGDDVPIWMR